MSPESLTVLVLDLVGTFAFALNGALTAIRVARVDIVGVVTLGMVTAMGGGILRDVLMGSLPPTTFSDWRYLVVAASGGLLAYLAAQRLGRLSRAIVVLDAAGLSLFAVTGAGLALQLGLGAGQAMILGAISAVGGGTLRDVLVGRVPVVLTSDLYAVPALLAALVVVAGDSLGTDGPVTAVVGAAVCFGVRMLGVRYRLQAPRPYGVPGSPEARARVHDGSMRISARNQLDGTVTRIDVGAVTTTVKVELAGGGTITSSITKEAAEELGLEVGSPVRAVVKASDVLLAVD